MPTLKTSWVARAINGVKTRTYAWTHAKCCYYGDPANGVTVADVLAQLKEAAENGAGGGALKTTALTVTSGDEAFGLIYESGHLDGTHVNTSYKGYALEGEIPDATTIITARWEAKERWRQYICCPFVYPNNKFIIYAARQSFAGAAIDTTTNIRLDGSDWYISGNRFKLPVKDKSTEITMYFAYV